MNKFNDKKIYKKNYKTTDQYRPKLHCYFPEQLLNTNEIQYTFDSIEVASVDIDKPEGSMHNCIKTPTSHVIPEFFEEKIRNLPHLNLPGAETGILLTIQEHRCFFELKP
jgi:hypothetical protein